MEYFIIFVSAILVNNIVFSQFLGICPFLGVSQKLSTALGMGAAVTFVVTIATLVTMAINHFILVPYNLGYMMTISFILVIASLVQMVEIILKKISPALYQALGVFLPLITTNCMILGAAIIIVQKDYDLLRSLTFAISTAIGYTIALVIFSVIREQLAQTDVPKALKGIPIALIVAGILALSFMGFGGLV
ncbi:MAG: RnfABCDGE type electron transport complex subunit A [Porphyromonas sp.]|nr:RnfABCDGE type electron transport complex subunit A [Porphyromonas sp.]